MHAWQATSRPRSEPIGVRWLIAPRDVGGGVVQLPGALATPGVEAAPGLAVRAGGCPEELVDEEPKRPGREVFAERAR